MRGVGYRWSVGGRQVNLEEAVMGSAIVQGQTWVTVPCEGGGHSGTVSRFGFALCPVLAIPAGLGSQNVRSVR
jgi:hypothetical protein